MVNLCVSELGSTRRVNVFDLVIGTVQLMGALGELFGKTGTYIRGSLTGRAIDRVQ